MEPIKTEEKRNSDGTFAEGTAPGPGRPKGKTMKEFAREYFMLKSDADKIAYIENLEKVKPGFAWTMGEGNPDNNQDITSGGKPIIISVPSSVADRFNLNDTPDTETE